MTIKLNNNVTRIVITAALATLLVPAGFAQKQSRKTVEDGAQAAKKSARHAAHPKDLPNKGSEVFTNVTIGPGQSTALDSGLDYSNADMVRVSVRSENADLSDLQFVAYWAVDGTDFYNATEAADGSTFIYGNVGGAQFCVYGSQFRLVLKNTGSSTINLVQVMLFAPATPPPVGPDEPASTR